MKKIFFGKDQANFITDNFKGIPIKPDMENIKELKNILSIPRDIVITSHRNPDGDAIGSSLALYHYLIRNGHTVKVMFPSEYPANFAWMPDADKILIHDIEPEDCNGYLKKANIIFSLDYNALERVDKMGEIIGVSSGVKVLIDHHLYPENFAEYVLSDTTASSTCELIYDFLVMMDEKKGIDLTVGECMFTGILTDTGSFKYSTSPKLFRIVADLLERGVDDYVLQDLIFNSMTEKQLRIMGHILNNRMEILPEYKTGIITLTKKDYEDFNIQRGDTEGVVNQILMMKKVKVAVFIHEQPTIVKLSMRSKGDFSVQEICRKYFRGGGHKNASGGASYSGLSATVNKFKKLLPEFKEQLDAL
ncbi:MAG: bifunctional oligoribonuclease/PAP phosphatase NrnA [Saprospiraceae bacterium]|nr:bifunctional oligoribonuclease/PAP phosphatase NrnA [Saprospiraceae bacterium]